MSKIVYIAGPYRGATINETYNNIQAARDVACFFAKKGVMFFCPHTHTAMMDGVTSDEFFLEMGKEFIKKCDAVYMVDGWEKSVGSVAEKKLAEELGMPVFECLYVAVVSVKNEE